MNTEQTSKNVFMYIMPFSCMQLHIHQLLLYINYYQIYIIYYYQLNYLIFAGFGQVRTGMPIFHQNNKVANFWEQLSYFFICFMQLHIQGSLSVIMSVYLENGAACTKFCEITNRQYLWKGLSDFVDCSYLHLVRLPLNLPKATISCQHCQTLSQSDCQVFLNFKNSKTI